MSEVQTSMPATLTTSVPSPTASHNAPTMLRTCLVVSASTRRAQRFVEAASDEQWATIVCQSAEEAARQAMRNRVQMALVDLESAPVASEPPLRKLVEQLAGKDGPLLAVCGKPNHAECEVWSRQLGVWMFLPGINGGSDVALLYGEARRIVEKLEGGPPHLTNGLNGSNGSHRGVRLPR